MRTVGCVSCNVVVFILRSSRHAPSPHSSCHIHERVGKRFGWMILVVPIVYLHYDVSLLLDILDSLKAYSPDRVVSGLFWTCMGLMVAD